MKPWRINLAILALLVAVACGVRLFFGQGVFLNGVLGFFGLAWGAQVAALWWSARQQRTPPTFTSTHLVALWAAALYPLVATSSPTLTFPTWFVVASAPIGYLMVYATMGAFLWIMRWQFRFLSRLRNK
jgi:hypothetical protein